MKRVRFSNKDPEAIRGFIDEITLLKQLRHTPNIIQLVNAQVGGGEKERKEGVWDCVRIILIIFGPWQVVCLVCRLPCESG